MLSANQLNLVLLIVAEFDTVLLKLKGALSWVFVLEVVHKVLARDLVLCNLVDRVAVSREESFLLVEHFRSTRQGVAGEPCLSFAHILSHLKVGIDASFLD